MADAVDVPVSDRNNSSTKMNIIRKHTTATALSWGLAACALTLTRGDDHPAIEQLQIIKDQVIQELVGQAT